MFSSILHGDIADWPRNVKKEVGLLLINIFLESARFKKTHINPETEEVVEEEVCPFFIEEVFDLAYYNRFDCISHRYFV